MSQPHPHGEGRNIISFSDNNVNFDEVKLSHLLLHPQVKDREIAVISIVGAYRKGKSFFMDYCLRFMYAHVSLA
jgi:atlastin